MIDIGYGKDREKKVEEFKERCKTEKDMNAPEITEMVEAEYEKLKYLTVKERFSHGGATGPFDLIAGKLQSNNGIDEINIIGFEVKADKDDFSRLNRQIREYSDICDRVYVVVHKKEIPPLPDHVGIIRVSDNGEMVEEKWAYAFNRFPEISTYSEWKSLMDACGLGTKIKTLNKIFNITPKIWKKVLFNRYFGKMDYSSTPKYIKHYPFSKEEMEFIIGHQLDYQIKTMMRKVREIKRLAESTERFLREEHDKIDTQKSLEVK